MEHGEEDVVSVRLIFVIGIAQPPTRSECLPDRPLLLFVKLIFLFFIFIVVYC